jgi:glucuronoarabinoxylan endo-1,4-beta-xylanase
MHNGTLRRSLLACLLFGGIACANGSNSIEGAGGSSEGGNQGSGGSSSGGTTGSGGSGESGGTTGSGGASATGGSSASGGSGGSGGSSSTGGNSGTGGLTGIGGAAGHGSGGVTGTGGAAGHGPGGAAGHGSGGAAGAGTGGSGTGGTASGGSGTGTGGAGGMYVGTKTAGTPQSGDVTVDPTKTHQIVDGFGEADVWQGSSSTQMQTLLWDPVNGIGLNLLRVGIDGTSGSANIMGAAGYADGTACVKFNGSACKVWAAPWSPPASMKDNNNVNNGGHLNSGNYAAWAKILAAFPAFYKSHGGVDLYAISAQNEPDFTASYQSCLFNASQMTAWIDVLGPALAALSPPVSVLAAEPDNWGNIWGGDGYGPAIIADANANKYVSIIATHDYGGTSAGTYSRPAPPSNNTHHVWETECTPGDTGPITIATMIYAAFTGGNVNGWHYWWTEALVPNAGSPPPQVYALGNFSKFVRPGYYRVDVSNGPKASGTTPLVVAFSNLSDGTVAIVVVNGGSAANISFFVAGTAWPASVTPYVTTSSSKLAAGSAISVSGGRFSASLAAQSVTTFVGKP